MGPLNGNFYGQNFEVIESPGQSGRQLYITNILNKVKEFKPILSVLEVLILPDTNYFTNQRYFELSVDSGPILGTMAHGGSGDQILMFGSF